MKQILAYQLFLKKGRSDYRVAVKLLEDEELELDIICFHLQQCVEKFLKSFLIFNNHQPKKIHDIGLLLMKCIELDSDFSIFENSLIVDLTDCGVLISYDEIEEIDKDFIDKVVNSVLEFNIFIEKKLEIQT